MRLAAGFLLTALFALAWLAFAPTQLGGQSTYVLTDGTSMQPTFHTNDLVILRRALSYEVGDVVAYHNPTLGQVFHRIIARDGERFVVKGDNNPKPDIYTPAESELLGKLWLHIPDGGLLLLAARQPPVAAALAGGVLLMTATVPVARRRRRFFHRRGPDGGPRGGRRGGPAKGRSTTVLGTLGQSAAAVALLLGLAGAALGAYAYSQPVDRATTASLPYRHAVALSYTAPAPFGVYPSGSIQTGQPIYTKVTPAVTFSAAYALEGDASGASGTIGLNAIIRAADGWTRTLPLQASTPFEGTHGTATGTLSIAAVESAIESYRQGALLPETPLSTVILQPDVAVSATVAGAQLRDTYSPPIQFTWNGYTMNLAEGSSLGPQEARNLSVPSIVANTFDVLSVGAPIAGLRATSIGMLLAALLLGLVVGLFGWRASGAPESARIRGRYGSLIVTLRSSDIGADPRLFEVASIEDLVRIAEREGRMILHETQGRRHAYYVQDAEVTYRYETWDGRATEAEVPSAEATP